ncbi:MAG TPA: hypothetical protein VFP05_04285 [Thermomicrobiales bacterium]|nr:hypothetical protein [Thermomicrobiales bacterium]
MRNERTLSSDISQEGSAISPRRSSPLRVVVATEDSRDPIALALAFQRPQVDVVQIAPHDLACELSRRSADLVIHDRPNPAVPVLAVAWIRLLIDGASRAIVHICGQEWELAVAGMKDLLDTVDLVARNRPNAIP